MAHVEAELPHLHVFQRVSGLPVIELAVATTLSTYTRLKDSHHLIKWALKCVESTIGTASRTAAPFAKTFEPSLNFVDHKLCLGLDEIERKVPIVKEKPDMILEKSYMLAVETMQPTISKIAYANDYITSRATTIKDISWNKINQILNTEFGTAAVIGVDNTAFLVDMVIDKYFPPVMEEEKPAELISIQQDKLMHTIQTVGRLSNKATRRVITRVSYQLRILNKDNLRSYLQHLMEFLHVVRPINEMWCRTATSCSAQVAAPANAVAERNGKNNAPTPAPCPAEQFQLEPEQL